MVKISSVMKKVLTISILAALALCSCQKEAMRSGEANQAPRTITASIADGATKTTLGTGDNDGKILWQAGDEVAVWSTETYCQVSKYRVSEDSDGKNSATLEWVSTEEGRNCGWTDEAPAYYPYSDDVEWEYFPDADGDGTNDCSFIFKTTLSPTQKYTKNSFASGAFHMASWTRVNNMQFKNVLGGVKLQLTGSAAIKEIKFYGNNDEIICQGAEVALSSVSSKTVPIIKMTGGIDDKEVTLDCGEYGVNLSEDVAKSFIIALPPMTMSKGFTIEVKDISGQSMTFTSTREQKIERSQLLEMTPVKYAPPFKITAVGAPVNVKFEKVGSPDDIYLESRKIGGVWTDYTVGNEINLTSGEYVEFRADRDKSSFGALGKSKSDYHKISVSGAGKIKVSGHILSLVTYFSSTQYACARLFKDCTALTDASGLMLSYPGTYQYYATFSGCTNLTAAPILYSGDSTLGVGAYEYMFANCTSLTKTPILLSMKLNNACYSSMFSGCTSLKNVIGGLQATDLKPNCYEYMFAGCTSLEIPPALPATTLADKCYQYMFQNCSALLSAPKLPATTLDNGCYKYMFQGCSHLAGVPDILPATTLADECYRGMFQYCEALSKAPILPAKTLVTSCYAYMFDECINLNYVKALFTKTSGNYYLSEWLDGVASKGTFVKSSALSWSKDNLGLPSGWSLESCDE